MADQLVAATIKVLLEKAVSVAADKINVVLGFRKDLEAMQEHAKDIQAVLADAETKQSRNPMVMRWLHKVEAAAVEADNVLDELLYESLRRKVESRNKAKMAAKVCLFFSLSKHDLSFRGRMSSKVREINEMLKNFILEVPGIGLIRMEDAMATPTPDVVTDRQTNSLPLPFVAGRAKEVSQVVDILLSKTNDSVSVLSIVGMGGLGKTTLAKSVYNNTQIDNHFGQKIWVCVSDKFQGTELFRLILESLEGGNMEKYSGQDPIVRKIQEKLAGKRFLLVLDDVWNKDQKLWDAFFTSLVGLSTASGSCCLVTTRLQQTAKLVSNVDPFELDKLADDECWYILCRRATKDGEMPQELDAHRDQILKRCQGLPLAANAVGGLLSLQRREEWLSIVEDKILQVSEYVEGEITAILRLSFDYLPSLSIKKCFAYCSIYSKDEKIYGRDLVELWMAEGFPQEGVERRTMEEVGHDYLTVLLQSSLLEKVYDKWYSEGTYQMHDLVHDLAQSVSEREQIDGEVRHLALASNYIEYNARSTLVQIVKGEISDKVLLKFQRLRVLNLCGTEKLPNAIGKAKHLRYLDISSSPIKVLPDSLCKLYYLQTLKLVGSSLQCLPPGFSNLISLRHLHFAPSDMKFKMPPNMGQLTCLQTLEFFNVGKENGYEIKELGSMKNLAGNIWISNLELVKGKEGAKLANLFEKKKLVGLDLSWGSTDRGDNGNCNDEHVLEGLEPHPKLQGLRLKNYIGARLPQWLGQMKALTTLVFINCKTFKDLPTLGHLPYLEYLGMEGLDGVTCIGESFYHEGLWEGKVFPSLKYMEMKLPNLREWKGLEAANGHVFPKLMYLRIEDCCQLASFPSSFPSLERLGIWGNIQVSVVRDIIGKSASLLKKLSIGSMGGLNSLAHVIENPLTCLEHLEIYSCDNLTDISTVEFRASLRSLNVRWCPEVMSCALNLQLIPSLSILNLSRCPNMFSTNVMPTGFRYLTNLRDLEIGPFTDDSIQSFDWSGLIACSSTLNRLYWWGSLQKHSGLPQQLQHLTSLQNLYLCSLNSVEALPDWLGNLTSLTDLVVVDCPILRCLPSAHAMRRLTNLRVLQINNCPLITESSIQEISSSLPNLNISRQEMHYDVHSVWFWWKRVVFNFLHVDSCFKG